MNSNFLKEDEEICDLQCEGLVLIQKKSGYSFTTDAVLLANFIKEKEGLTIVEFCAGSGVISILLTAKIHPQKIYAIEIQENMADMCARSVKLNGLKNIEVVNSSFQNFTKNSGAMPNIIVANPPYFKAKEGRLPKKEEVLKARFEIDMDISSLIISAKKMLTSGGSLYLVHRTERKTEIVKELEKQGFYIKKLCYCFPKKSKPSHIFLVQAVLNEKCETEILEPIILCNEDGTETDMIKRIYNRNSAI
ncbi:MAG: methyltransferase [Clostridia bacterium]|nr:methyltransferase [Clostridia bacterium]